MATLSTKNTINLIQECNNEELRELVTEIHDIGVDTTPIFFKQSKKMKELFKSAKTETSYWSDDFYTVKRVIESEILYRFRQNNL